MGSERRTPGLVELGECLQCVGRLLTPNLVLDGDDRLQRGHPHQRLGWEPAHIEPSQVGVLDDEEDHRQVGPGAHLLGVCLDRSGVGGVEAVGVPQQQRVDPDRGGVVCHGHDVGHGVEHPLEDETLPSSGFVDCHLHEAAHLISRRAPLRDEQRTPEAEFDVPSHVVTDPGLVERPKVGGERGDDHVAYPVEGLRGPSLGLAPRVGQRHFAHELAVRSRLALCSRYRHRAAASRSPRPAAADSS